MTPLATPARLSPARGRGRVDGTRQVFLVRYLVAVILAAVGLTVVFDAQIFVPLLAQGLLVTTWVTAASAALAVPVAVLAALVREYAPRPAASIAIVYVEVFRGTSTVVQLFWMFFVLPHFGVELSAATTAILALGLNVGAYGCEIVRGALRAIPRPQWEAAFALGMPWARTLRLVVFPQAVAAMIPSWGNLLIELLKATSIVSLITLPDLAFRAQQLNLATYRTAEIFSLVLLLYLMLSLCIALLVGAVERRIGTVQERAA